MTQKSTIRTEVVGNDTNRYLLKIEWDKTAPSALVIMLQAGKTNGISFDRSTNYCLSNLTRLGYGSVSIVNLFSNLGGEIGEADEEKNLEAISSALENVDAVIYAAGTGRDCNKKVIARKKKVMTLLKESGKKLFCIADSEGKPFYHPLCPKVSTWNLSEFEVTDDAESSGQT